MLTAIVVACLVAYLLWYSRRQSSASLANSSQQIPRLQRWYLFFSPLPVLLGIVVPLVLNLATHFAMGVRKTNMLLTDISIAASAIFVLMGGLLMGMNLRRRSEGVTGLLVATILAGIPLAAILFYGGASWIVSSFPNR
jgi:hypothetical protein